jgi:hypothetical protein
MHQGLLMGYSASVMPPSTTTWDLVNKGASWSLSNGNLTASSTGAFNQSVCDTNAIGSAKIYWEVTPTTLSNTTDGYAGVTDQSGGRDAFARAFFWLPNGTGSAGAGGTSGGTSSSFTTGDVLGFAYDYTLKMLFLRKNGTWLFGADPAAGSGAAWTFTTAAPVLATLRRNNNSSGTFAFVLNCGAVAFAHAPPSGFGAL